MGVVSFIVLACGLVLVHELGHFVVAKALGVRVLRFSIGFGPPLLKTTIGGTEFVLAAIPLGGYVRLWGEPGDKRSREGNDRRRFEDRGFLARAAIVVAGPLMNLLLPLVLFFIVYSGHDTLAPAHVGTVFPDRPADGVLFPGDSISAVDGNAINTFDELRRAIASSADETVHLTVWRRGERFIVPLVPASTEDHIGLGESRVVGRVGIAPFDRAPIVGVLPESPAFEAGLRTFDRIVAIQGRSVDSFLELASFFERPPALISIVYYRPEEVEIEGLGRVMVYRPRVANLSPAAGRAPGFDRSGLESADLYVNRVAQGSAEAQAGLRRGDRLLYVDGQAVRLMSQARTLLRGTRNGGEHTLVWRRGKELMEAHLRLPIEHNRCVLGFSGWMPLSVPESVENPAPIRYALRRAWRETSDMVRLTVSSVGQVITGQMSLAAIGGPIMMVDAAAIAARHGQADFLRFLAFISINLGLLNLLPIPLLDGGHLLFILIQTLIHRPIRQRTRRIAYVAGAVVLSALTILAIYNDLTRSSRFPIVFDEEFEMLDAPLETNMEPTP